MDESDMKNECLRQDTDVNIISLKKYSYKISDERNWRTK